MSDGFTSNSATHSAVPAIESSAAKTLEWLRAIQDASGTDHPTLAYHALGATLRSVRDRIPVGAAVHFGGQLPVFIRGLYYDGYEPEHTPTKERTVAEFLATVRSHLNFKHDQADGDAGLEKLVRAVFQTVNAQMDPGQVAKTRHNLHAELQSLWPEA